MVSFAKVVAVLLLLIGILAFLIGLLSLADGPIERSQGGYQASNQLLYTVQMFSGLILVALALCLYMLAYIAKEPAERHQQKIEAKRSAEAREYDAEHQVGARLGPRK
jgi:multisubunit Na+/H+ antiporter MnhB subunit